MDSHHQHPASETGVLLIELQGKEYPTEQLKMVSAAGLAPEIPRSHAECVGCYATRCSPQRFVKKPPGSCFLWRRRTPFLETGSRTRMADPKGVAPSAFPQTTGCSAY